LIPVFPKIGFSVTLIGHVFGVPIQVIPGCRPITQSTVNIIVQQIVLEKQNILQKPSTIKRFNSVIQLT
jgi:hypothetical protein